MSPQDQKFYQEAGETNSMDYVDSGKQRPKLPWGDPQSLTVSHLACGEQSSIGGRMHSGTRDLRSRRPGHFLLVEGAEELGELRPYSMAGLRAA